MDKLFPPVIEATIPAFYNDTDKGIVITVPFSMNRGISKTQVGGFALKAKTVQSSSYLFTLETYDINTFNIEDSPWVSFTLSDTEAKYLKVGQFYKFQIAYISTDLDKEGNITAKTVGYYSTVGVGKYTRKPELYISTGNTVDNGGLKIGQINMHQYDYVGHYSQYKGDTSERVYSYQFDVYNSNQELIASSGEQLHNSSNDVEIYESYDSFTLSQDLEIDKSFYIQYTIITNNGLKLSTPKYRLMQKTSINPEMDATMKATLNFDNGYIDIDLIGTKNQHGLETPVTGAFLITRASEDDNFTTWNEISRFKLQAQNPSRWLWRDYTVEQGKNYIYAIQQYNDAGLYSNRIESNKIYVDFEDAFLYDGKKQLKIRYNPKVSSLKVDTQEAKVNTIGAKHPFIFRNGRVYYREFPISGLISYFMDNDNIFMNKEEFMVNEKTTDLLSDNLAKERIFKTKVLEWLTDGNPKLFRSPTEGNFIVRLLNTSITPHDQVGRMLHTFNTTAYEIADFNYEQLNKYGFITLEDPEVPYMRWMTVNFYDRYEDGTIIYKTGQVNRNPAVTARIDNMMPGDIIYFQTANHAPGEYEEIIIGITGSYYIDIGTEITAIIIPEGMQYSGSMTYSYYSIQQNAFNKIANVNIVEVPTQQFIGTNDVIKNIEYVVMPDNSLVENPKNDIIEFYNIHVQKRTIERLVIGQDGNYYVDKDCKVPLGDNYDKFTLFAVGTWEEKLYDENYKPSNGMYDEYPGGYYSPVHEKWVWTLKYYLDMNTKTKIDILDYDPCVYINGNQISVEDTIEYDIGRVGKLKSFTVGNGAWVYCAYQMRVIDYLIEDDTSWDVYLIKQEYKRMVNDLRVYQAENELLEDMIMQPGVEDLSPEKYEEMAKQETQLRDNINRVYQTFLQTLIEEQEKEKVADGLL